jgi:hypothetical protein
MLLTPADVTLRRDELSDVLKLSPAVVDALIASGAIATEKRDGREVVAAASLERVFRDALMRLYQTQAQAVARAEEQPIRLEDTSEEIEIEAKPESAEAAQEPDPEITLSMTDEIMATGERPDLRAGLRYVPRRQIGGTFRDARFVMLQLSSSGLRIRHDEALRPGEEARLSFAILTPPKSFVMRARVVWTSIAQRGDERSYYVSGLRIIENADRLVNAAYLLRSSRELQIDDRDVRRRPGSPEKVARPVSGLPDEDVVAIIQAVRKLAADPTEAARWYARARYAVSDEEVRKVAPRGAREREEVLGVWEYLERRIDVRAVAGVMQWIRSSQVAAV